MSHKIFGERFTSRGEPAWHNLGTVFPAGTVLSATEAVRQVAEDVHIVAKPVYIDLGKGLERFGDYQAIVREATANEPAEGLGIVTERWHPMSYVELAGALDELSKSYKVETAGVLEGGALCFLALRGTDWQVADTDEMRSYFLANLSLQPGRGHRILHTPVRVVCWNTNTLASEKATINLSVPHGIDARVQLEIGATLVARFQEVAAETKAMFDAFAGHQITREDALKVFRAAFPDPQKPAKLRLLERLYGTEGMVLAQKQISGIETFIGAQENYEKQVDSTLELRKAAETQWETFEPSPLRTTLWGAYNAVTEVADWRGGKSADISCVWGSRAREKARAFAACLEIGKN